MDNPDITAVEPRGKELFFKSRQSLYDHVCKHLLEGKNERWKTLIDPELLSEARRNFDDSFSFDESYALSEVANQYQKIVASALYRCCTERKDHVHSIDYVVLITLPNKTEKKPFQQYIFAMERDAKFFIVASRALESEEAEYRIKSAFRPDKRIQRSEKTFIKWVNDRIDRESLNYPNLVVLVEHR